MGSDNSTWKHTYIKALIEHLCPEGDVLEVGSGEGAQCIQSFHPKSHTIIEPDAQLASEIKMWSQKFQNIFIIEGDWEEKLETLGQFDTILFHDSPLDLELFECHAPDETSLTKAKKVLNDLKTRIAAMPVRYTDEEIDEFYESTGKQRIKDLPVFFDNLKKNGFITAEQYERAIEKYCSITVDKCISFIESCLDGHTHKGSRITCMLTDAKSKYEDPLFFDRIITNPNLHYEENIVPIEIPGRPLIQAIAMVIKRIH